MEKLDNLCAISAAAAARAPRGAQIPFRSVGPLVITVAKMIAGDVFRFLVVYVVMLGGFALGLCLLAQVRAAARAGWRARPCGRKRSYSSGVWLGGTPAARPRPPGPGPLGCVGGRAGGPLSLSLSLRLLAQPAGKHSPGTNEPRLHSHSHRPPPPGPGSCG